MEKQDERRKRFFPVVSLGNLIAILVFLASAAGVYTQVIADVSNAKTEIVNIKQEAVKRESADRESRQEIRQEIRDVKGDVKSVNEKLDRILFELGRIPKPAARRE